MTSTPCIILWGDKPRENSDQFAVEELNRRSVEELQGAVA